MKAHDDLTFNMIGATMAHDNLTFNVMGATIESPSQNPPACLYKPRVCGNKAELLRRNPCRVWLSLARRGARLADSKLTSPRNLLALLREVPLPLSFCRAAPACKYLWKWLRESVYDEQWEVLILRTPSSFSLCMFLTSPYQSPEKPVCRTRSTS